MEQMEKEGKIATSGKERGRGKKGTPRVIFPAKDADPWKAVPKGGL